MKARLRFLFFYLLFWLLLFIIGKFVFLFYQFNQSFSLPVADWFNIIRHGLKLDLSTLGYASIIPVLTLSVTSFWKGKLACRIINIYTLVALFLFILISLSDLIIYKAWSVRFDVSPLQYLVTPREVVANLAWYYFILLLGIISVIFWLLYSIYRRRIHNFLQEASKSGWKSSLLFFILLLFLFLPIRGGLRTTPINVSSAYFHKNVFANQAAVNVMWNFGQSVVNGKETRNPYIFYKHEGYEMNLKKLYDAGNEPVKILKHDRPTIILVMMETFTAKLIEPLGGTPGVTPNFNRLAREGVLFANMYANGTRTDRGMVSIVSGFPTIEPLRVLRYPEKTLNMAFLSRDLIREGYHASFYYGGEVDFANMKSYLLNGGFNPIYSEKDFSYYHGYRSNWGVPDNIAFDKLVDEVNSQTGPCLHMMLTLSNHEPFDIPVEPHFGGFPFRNKFYSSAYFADSCLGDFIAKMKSSNRWDSCLIILVADHGSPFPDFDQYHEPGKYKIPMLWLGGALKTDTVITKYCTQSDIAVTLLKQLGIDSDHYILGKDILSPSSRSFAFYSFMDGMAMMTDSVSFGFDFKSKNLLFSTGDVTSDHIGYIKALQQYIYDYYLSL
ncbi:MAG: LTA synthase family protein [Bacteroidales bacterium]|nr:LTA synthase family protein [Bacteroidales bacterium]